nr:hypothetical protein Iba_chr06aCG7840 [Ipomoea batatas]GMD11788.1 hypothetical protein Iba_chr06fCG7070 [Ipomoea batatas]
MKHSSSQLLPTTLIQRCFLPPPTFLTSNNSRLCHHQGIRLFRQISHNHRDFCLPNSTDLGTSLQCHILPSILIPVLLSRLLHTQFQHHQVVGQPSPVEFSIQILSRMLLPFPRLMYLFQFPSCILHSLEKDLPISSQQQCDHLPNL